jgi:DNA-directed RNA polymerase specialized sigma24 family protein
MRYAVYAELRKVMRPRGEHADRVVVGAESTAVSNLAAAELWALVGRLGPKRREAFMLAYSGKNLMAEARRRGVDQRLILRNASQAREQLRKWLEVT